jgi:hypothetical protein
MLGDNCFVFYFADWQLNRFIHKTKLCVSCFELYGFDFNSVCYGTLVF